MPRFNRGQNMKVGEVYYYKGNELLGRNELVQIVTPVRQPIEGDPDGPSVDVQPIHGAGSAIYPVYTKLLCRIPWRLKKEPWFNRTDEPTPENDPIGRFSPPVEEKVEV